VTGPKVSNLLVKLTLMIKQIDVRERGESQTRLVISIRGQS